MTLQEDVTKHVAPASLRDDIQQIATLEDLEEEEPPASAAKKKHSLTGILLIMLGSFSFSVMFLLVKLMASMNTFTLVFYRSLVQIAISLIELYRKGENPLGPPDVRVYLVLRAVFGAAAVCAWFFGIQLLPLPDAVTLQFTTPPFAGLFAVFIVGEKWKVLDMIGAVVCLTGVVLIAHPTWLFEGGRTSDNDDGATTSSTKPSAGPLKVLAVLVTTAGAAMAGIAYVLVRKIGDRVDAVVMVLYYGVLSIPMTFLGSGFFLHDWKVWGDFEHFTIKDYVLLFLMGIAGYGGQWFTNLGLQHETAATATLATSTQIVWTYIFELTFLHEPLEMWSLAGTCLIMGYMLIVAVIKMMESSGMLFAKSKTNDEEVGLLMEEPKSDYDTLKQEPESS